MYDHYHSEFSGFVGYYEIASAMGVVLAYSPRKKEFVTWRKEHPSTGGGVAEGRYTGSGKKALKAFAERAEIPLARAKKAVIDGIFNLHYQQSFDENAIEAMSDSLIGTGVLGV